MSGRPSGRLCFLEPSHAISNTHLQLGVGFVIIICSFWVLHHKYVYCAIWLLAIVCCVCQPAAGNKTNRNEPNQSKPYREQQEGHTAYTQFPSCLHYAAAFVARVNCFCPSVCLWLCAFSLQLLPVQLGLMAGQEDASASLWTLLKLGRQLNLCPPIQNNPNFAYFLFEV